MARSPPSCLLPALRFALSSLAPGAALPVKWCLCFWLCAPCPQAPLPISPRTLTSGPLCAGTPSHPLSPHRGQGLVALKPCGGGHQEVLLGTGRGTPQPVSSVSALFLYPCGGQKWDQGSSAVAGSMGCRGDLAQPHSRSPLCAPCLVTQAEEKFLENYNFVS